MGQETPRHRRAAARRVSARPSSWGAARVRPLRQRRSRGARQASPGPERPRRRAATLIDAEKYRAPYASIKWKTGHAMPPTWCTLRPGACVPHPRVARSRRQRPTRFPVQFLWRGFVRLSSSLAHVTPRGTAGLPCPEGHWLGVPAKTTPDLQTRQSLSVDSCERTIQAGNPPSRVHSRRTGGNKAGRIP